MSKTSTSISAYTGKATYEKSNALIMSWSTAPLLTNKLFMVGAMQATEQDDGSYASVIPGAILRKIFKNDSGSFYRRVREACYNPKNPGDPGVLINYKTFFEDEESHEFLVQNLVMDAGFKNNTLFISYNPHAVQYIFGLRSRYTELDADVMLSLESNYTWRMYELFQRHIGLKDFETNKRGKKEVYPYVMTFGLTRLKLSLGVIDINRKEVYEIVDRTGQLGRTRTDGDYIGYYDEDVEALDTSSNARFSNFRVNVLEHAQTEMEEKTGLYFDFDTTRGYGGKITHITFRVFDKRHDKKEEAEEKPPVDIDDLIDEIRDIVGTRLPTRDIRAIGETAEYDMEKVRKAVQVARETTDIGNLTGFLITAIREGYSPHTKQGTYGERDYDFDSLERAFMEN